MSHQQYFSPARLLHRGMIPSAVPADIPVLDHRVVGIRECCCRVEFFHGEKLLRSGSEFADFEGGQSVEQALEEARHLCASYKIDLGSTVECRVTGTIIEFTGLDTLESDIRGRAKIQFHEAEPGFEPQLICETILWSSKNTIDAKQPIVQEFLRQANAGVVQALDLYQDQAYRIAAVKED